MDYFFIGKYFDAWLVVMCLFMCEIEGLIVLVIFVEDSCGFQLFL